MERAIANDKVSSTDQGGRLSLSFFLTEQMPLSGNSPPPLFLRAGVISAGDLKGHLLEPLAPA